MRNDLFQELMESVKEAGAIRRGERAPARVTTATQLGMPHLDVMRVRNRLNLSRSKFADLLGISMRTLEGWEQKRRRPDGPARILLSVAATHPEAVLDTVARFQRKMTGARGGVTRTRTRTARRVRA